MDIAAAAFWGFLVGFVGWGGAFRVVGPIAVWLVGGKDSAPVVVLISWTIVMLFVIMATMLSLTLIPLILLTSGHLHVGDNQAWRNVFGAAFVGSMGGFFTLGLLTKLRRRGYRRK